MTDQTAFNENPNVLEYVLPKSVLVDKKRYALEYTELRDPFNGSTVYVYRYISKTNKGYDTACPKEVGPLVSVDKSRQQALYKMKELAYRYEIALKKGKGLL